MKVLIQRATWARATVDGQIVGAIGPGLLVFLGVAKGDSEKEADWLAEKITNLRIFADQAGQMNRSLLEIQGSILLVSQFTLLGDCRKGRRPSFSEAEAPARAEELYLYLGRRLAESAPVSYGAFGAHMKISLENDGPVTFLVENVVAK
jgi:D-tyrosyl-tRNA(Tyr) deacylase